MSASRKKQERKLAEAPELSAREQEEMLKEAQRKRNTVIYTIIGVVVVILAAILLIWDSGVFQRNATVATIDGEKVTPAQVAFHYYSNDLANTAATYSQYGLTMPYSPSESAKEQIITAADIEEWASYGFILDASYEGKTYHDYFLDSALEVLRAEYAVLAVAKENGYTLSELGKAAVQDEMDALESTVDTYLAYGYNFTTKSYLKQVYGNNMTEKAFRTCLENSELASEYYNTNLKVLADYSDAELEAYYEEHTDELDSVHFYFRTFDGSAESTTDEEGNTVEPTDEETAAALEQAKADADAEAEKVKGDLSAVEDNEEYTEQKGRLTTTTSFYYDWVMDPERQAGDSTVFEGTGSYYVVVFANRFRDDTPTADIRHILVEAKNEDNPDTDADESTEDPTLKALDAAEQKAKELLAQWENGDKTPTSFGQLANEYSADTGSNTNGGLYTVVAPGDMIADFNDWVFAEGRQVGDTGLVKNTESYTQGWHVIYYQAHNEPVWKIAARDALWAAEVADTVEIVRTDKLDSAIG